MSAPRADRTRTGWLPATRQLEGAGSTVEVVGGAVCSCCGCVDTIGLERGAWECGECGWRYVPKRHGSSGRVLLYAVPEGDC